jgi:hypothetical protein
MRHPSTAWCLTLPIAMTLLPSAVPPAILQGARSTTTEPVHSHPDGRARCRAATVSGRSERSPEEVCPVEVRLAEVRPTEERPGEERSAEVRLSEVRIAEVRLSEVSLFEVRQRRWIFLSPFVPAFYSLLK